MQKSQVNVDELRRGGVVALKEQDKYSIWVKTACCNLNSKQLKKLADITDKYARGFFLFTSRQIPIIPHVDIQDVADVKRELAEVDMELDRCGSRVRNLNVCYEKKICPEAVVDCVSLGEKLEKFFGSQIMHKIKIGVVGCSRDCIFTRALTDIGFVGVEENTYDAYVGGRLGLNPFVGIKIVERISEDQSVKLVQNYFDLLEKQGKPGERSADQIKRLGAEKFRQELIKGLQELEKQTSSKCKTKLAKKQTDKYIIAIQANCGEVTSDQVRKIADVAEEFGNGIVHFAVRGSPEMAGIEKKHLPAIRQELEKVDLQLIENGVENFQSCFGGYCGEGLADPQSLLKRIDIRIKEMGEKDLKITVSGSGCPNSCGIPQLSDIGFHGVAEPEVNLANCTGCGLCLNVCKRKAIEIRNSQVVIDLDKCGHCGQCVAICPLDALREKRKGFAVLLGGRGGKDIRLGAKIAEFVSEDEALAITERLLSLVKDNGGDTGKTIDQFGIERVGSVIAPLANTEKGTR